ncbi:hypothetical protein HDV00_000274 [Rhizophlyctis rosea]|nr:hypothetical protein HDV00_000274 [Rhizophlyctis rosea]
MFGFDGFKQARKRAAHAKYVQLREDYIKSVLNLRGYDDRDIAAAYRIFDQDMVDFHRKYQNKEMQDFANHLARHDGAWAFPGVNKKIKTKAANTVEVHTEGVGKRKEVVGTHASDWFEVVDLTGEDS